VIRRLPGGPTAADIERAKRAAADVLAKDACATVSNLRPYGVVYDQDDELEGDAS
jgi:hypothetical protein